MDQNPTAVDAMIAAIAQAKERAESAARAAEEANAKANSESGFAYNAKQNAEDHAKAISQVRGTVDADLAWLSTTKKNAEETAQAVATARVACEADARIAAEGRTVIEKEVATIRAGSERATVALSSVERTQNDVLAAFKDVSTKSAEIEVSKAAAEASSATVQALQMQIAEAASKAGTDGAAIAKAESDAKSHLSSLSDVAVTVKAMHERVAQYERDLNQQAQMFKDLHSKIEGLLPNATSAGLASAFRNQKDRFKKPQRYWLVTFVAAISFLVVAGAVGLPGLWPNAGQASWDSIWRHFFVRLPLAVPLVWLAIYAGRHYMLALRVEEEYAFKEAISTTFEGYKRELAGIASAGGDSQPPLNAHCENVLRLLAQRPGRIYEGKQDDITPWTPLAKALGEVAQDTTKAKS